MKNLNLIKRLLSYSHEKQSPQRFARYAAMLIMLLTLGVGQMWGFDASSANIYYDNTSSNWSDVQLFIGHSGYSSVYSMTKLTNSNNLYYLRSFSWGGYGSFYFTTGASGWDSRSENVDDRVKYTTHYSAKKTDNLSNSTWLFISSGGSNGSSVSGSTVTDYDKLNYQQTVQQTLSTDGGSTYSASTASLATVKVASYYLSSATATSASSTSGTISAGNSSANCKAVRTATVTYTVSSVTTGYTFVGWYDGSTQKSTSTTYTYNATEAKTITARFKENRYSLTFSHNGHGTIKVGGSTVASGSTAYVNYFTTKTLVATPSTGYNFSGWTKSGTNTSAVTIGNASNASTTIKATNTGATITAGFTPKTTTITFNKQSGTDGSDGVTATYDAAMPDITPPTRDGYTFGGYYGAPGGSGPHYYNADGSSAATWNNENATYTLYAKWTENMSTVSLVASPTGKGSFTIGGDAATSTTAGVATTRSVTAVAISGYHFVSWAITGGATISGTTDNPVTVTGGGAGTAATLTATFAEDAANYTITYGVGTSYTSYGSVSEDHSYASGSEQTSGTEISLTASPNAHYKLAGWYSDASCSSAIAGAGTFNPYVFSLGANTSVYAKFVLIQTGITLNLHSGSGSTAVTATHGSALPDFTAATRTGYTLQGYYTAESSGTKIINADKSLVASVSGYTTSDKKWDYTGTALTLHAQWTINNHTITRTAPTNGSYTIKVGDASAVSTSTASDYNKTITLAATPNTGYHFTGWTVAKAGGGSITPSSSATANPATFAMPDDDVTVSATFAANTYTVTYNANGGTGTTANSAHTYGVAKALTSNGYTKTGYDFGGWATSKANADAGTVAYTNGQSVTNLSSDNGATVELFAKWTAKTYTVNFNQQSGTGGSSSVTATYDAAMPAATMPTRSGYIFDGYYTGENGTGTKYYNANGSSARTWNLTSTTMLYANWIQPQITYSNSNVSSVPASGTRFACGSTGNKMVITPNSGYKITGISPSNVAITASADGNATGSWTVTGTMPAEDVTLTITTAAVPEIRLLGRFRIYNSTHTTYTTINGSNMNWETSYANSHISMTYNHVTGYYELPTYRTYSELKADTEGDGHYFFMSSSSTKYGTSSNENTDVPSSKPGSANVHSSGGGGNFYFNNSYNLANVVLHFDLASYKFWLTGDTPTDNSVTFNAGDHGSITANATNITSGNSSSVTISSSGNTLSATPSSGYTFDHWETTGNVYVSFPNNASTIVVSTGAGGTVTAVWGVNSGWYLTGGDFGGWGTSNTSSPFNNGYPGQSGVFYRVVTLSTGDRYFKLSNGSSEYGPKPDGTVVSKNGSAISYTNESGYGAYKCNISGTAWFVINTNTKKLSIQDPYYKVTFGDNASGSAVSAVDGSSASLTSGNAYALGTAVTFSKSDPSGYSFVEWNTKADGSGETLGTGSTYSVASLSADVSVYAIYTETKYTVAFNNGDHGTVSPSGDQQVGAGGKTITATPAAGWMFDNWTKTGANVTLSSTTTNPTTVTAAGAGSVTANYKQRYILRGSQNASGNPAGGMAGWSATNNSSYASATIVGNVMTITANLTAASTEYKFMIRDIKDNAYKGQTGTGSMSDGDTWTLDGTNDVYFTTTLAGPYTFTYNVSTGSMTITYPTTYTVNFGVSPAGAASAPTNNRSLSDGGLIISGTSVTFTHAAANTGYTWSHWEVGGANVGTGDTYTRSITANTTVTAVYTENEYPVTVSAGSNGDVSPKGTVNIKQVSGTSLTATPNTGYHFVDWTISDGGITPGTSTSSTQVFKATEDGGSIQANFAEDMHTVTVATNNAAFGSVNHSSASAGIATASSTLTATPETGATFTGWTIPDGVTIVSPATSSSTSITIRATADSKTITANFSETKHSVTLTNESSTYGTVNTSSPVSVGQITAVQIQATPKSGYMLSGWVKTSGDGTVTYHTAAGTGQVVDPTGNTQATTYITVDDDVTLQATWEEDRSSGWYMRGNWTDGWTTSGQKAFVKDVGEGSGTVSHVRWTLDPRNFTNATMQMKMYDGADTYGHWNGDEASQNQCTKDGNNSNLGFYKDTGGDPHSNFRISISVYGEYDFEWDSSTKQLTVHYPTGNFIRGDFNSWGWEDLLTATGTANEYAGSIHLAANQTWTTPDNGFKAVILGDHYGKNSTNLTRASNSASDLSRSGANIGLTTDVAGDYTFTINTSEKSLSVTYPTAYTVTFGYGEGGSAVTASAESRGDGTFASGGYVAAGDDITFTQTPATGYTFKGWYTTADGNTEVSTMGVSDNVLNGLSGNATVYAQYTPTTYTNVTLNATTGSTNGAYSVTFGGTSITVTTDPLKTGYEPEGFYESYADGVWSNKIATSAGVLQNNTTYTDATGHWTATNRPTLYTKWQPKTYTIKLDKNGSSAGYLTDGSVTATYDAGLSILTVPTRTGYHIVDGYYKEPELTNKIINADGTLCASTAYTDASSHWTNDGTVTLYAKWAPDNYTITFNPNSGSVDPTSASVTFDAAIANAPVPNKTGYNFTGYNTAGGASITTNTGVFKADVSDFTDGSAHWVHADDATITAQWAAKTYTITLTQSGETGYGSAGTASVMATYDAALPTIASLPTAANGYAFMGYFTDHNGGGTKYYDADGTKMVASYTTADGVELFAYFKKAEITALAFDALNVDAGGTVGVTPTIDPTPVGDKIICWTILHDNDSPLDPQPEKTWNGTKLTFTASSYSGTYKVQAVLRTGLSCGGGTELDTRTESFTVAGTHTVTVNYKCGDDVIKTATSETATPLDWSGDITAPDIFGYTFTRWDAADGVTIKNGESTPVTTSTDATIKIKATYNGKLTAVYTQKSMIYFKNTLGWSDVYVNFYTGSYWNNPKGSGNQSVAKRNLAMTRYGETDIWYYDYGAASITPGLYVSFTSESQDNTQYFWKSGGVNVVYPANYADDIHTDKSSENGFKAATPMFVPLATQEKVTLNQSSGGKADYYNAGYWTKYLPGTGYTLEVYNPNGTLKASQVFTSLDDLMPMKAKLDLEGGTTYKFQLRRGGESSAGIYYGNTGTMTYSNHGQGTPWAMTNDMDPFKMVGITTNAAGDYTFNLSYSPNASDEYRLRIAVDYPVADGDYRLVYSDAVQTKPLTSAIVTKENDGSDIVSFFVRPGSSPAMKIQSATVNPSTGAVTWGSDVAIASATLTGLAGNDVYNFNLTMDGSGELSVASVEKYTGNFYIRTDAANSKWDNYKTDPDHLMTYSEYSIEHGGYTHYYCHWVNKDETGRKNVKFVIANDYSPNISDTLTRETAEGTWANIDDFMTTGGDLKRSANVRFMWDKRDNSISRAYVDGAQGDYSTNFLYMLNDEGEGADKIRKSDESALTDHKVTFKDNGNWMYEANIQAQPDAKIKLLSNWGTSNTITQYFRGASDATETLIGGSGSNWYDIRLIYDFKTNRLIAGLIPSGTIDEQMAIHADVMFIREHQGDIAQLTFAEKDSKMGAITDIETAFGVLRFNKWTINNKSKADGHAPLDPALSRFERDLFYVSFPFRVAMEDVFGFGTYGQHWIIEYYDGATRAANGYWAESSPNWKFVTNRKGKYFEPGQGYIIALDLDELGESSSVWANTDQVELYFPSYGTMPNITSSTATYEIPSHKCTINRTVQADGVTPTGLPAEYDRRVRDSHWNVLGVPTYVNPDAPSYANTDWKTEFGGPNFLYQVSWTDNSVSPVSSSTFTYHAMHAYLVQYCGNVTWTSSVSPSLAPRRNPEYRGNFEFRLEMLQNDKAVDRAFVKLSDDEHVTTGFEFNYDMSKEFNSKKANIYTLIGSEPVAGNVLPLTEQTTVVPVGVKIAANGDYTFSMPDGTEGTGITLIDNETGIRTPLGALDYTINLSAGTYDNRFVLEISPIKQMPTDIELLNGETGENGVRKVMIDGILYIVKGDKMFDATGRRVE